MAIKVDRVHGRRNDHLACSAQREREKRNRYVPNYYACINLKAHTFAEYISDKIGHRFVMFVDELHVLPYINRQILWQVSGLV